MSPSRDQLLVLAVLGVVGCGMMAGLLFAFSNFVMRALLQQPPESALRTMQDINSLIQNPVFFALFFGTTIATLLLAIHSALHLSEGGSVLLLLGSLLYLVGTFAVTVAFNVPLNNALAGHLPGSSEGVNYWPVYAERWLVWNHVRTVTSVVAAVLLTWAVSLVAQAHRL